MSRVQEYALELVMVGEERRKAQDFIDKIKMSVISHDPAFWIDRLFPRWRQGEDSNEVDLSQVDLDEALEDSDVEWTFDQVDPKEAERMLAELMASRGGTLSADDLDEEWS